MVRRRSEGPGIELFFDNTVDKEKQRRICVSLWAWAYEKHSDPLVSDAKFDKVCGEIDPSIRTGNDVLDDFFATKFGPETGQWVHVHPEKEKLETLYQRLLRNGSLEIIQRKMQ